MTHLTLALNPTSSTLGTNTEATTSPSAKVFDAKNAIVGKDTKDSEAATPAGSLAQQPNRQRMTPPHSTRELFSRMAALAGTGRVTAVDLGDIETDVMEHNSGRLLLKFPNGQVMGLDAFIREAKASGWLAEGAVIAVPIDSHEWREVGLFTKWAQKVVDDTGIHIAAYRRAAEAPPKGSITI
jgi:hypothetical protein